MGAAAPHGYKSADAIDRDNENVGVSRHYVYIMNGAVARQVDRRCPGMTSGTQGDNRLDFELWVATFEESLAVELARRIF